MPKSGKTTKQPSYGQAAGRLEEILVKIEEGQVDIDELSGLVREAAELVTLCRDKIQAAEVQVKTITEQLERDVPETPASEDTPTA
jgi:exodeoxyribonuclease VII small subunit